VCWHRYTVDKWLVAGALLTLPEQRIAMPPRPRNERVMDLGLIFNVDHAILLLTASASRHLPTFGAPLHCACSRRMLSLPGEGNSLTLLYSLWSPRRFAAAVLGVWLLVNVGIALGVIALIGGAEVLHEARSIVSKLLATIWDLRTHNTPCGLPPPPPPFPFFSCLPRVSGVPVGSYQPPTNPPKPRCTR